ncbi:MAG: lipoprotein [Proteobacteria bacterium]|nr:lipoprotein [Pseudomonadota bacterium]
MKNLTKNNHTTPYLNNSIHLIVVLLFMLLTSGCGNKGDLYHPEEQTNDQAVNTSVPVGNHRRHVSL